MSGGLKIEGLKELNKSLHRLGAKVANQITRAGIAAAAQAIRKEMRSAAPKKTGKLRKSIRYRIRRDASRRGFSAKVGVTGPGFYARFIEYGASSHRVPSELVGRRRDRRKNDARVAFDGGVYSNVNHPGISPKPFLRPAFDRSKRPALDAMKKRLWDRIRREAAKK